MTREEAHKKLYDVWSDEIPYDANVLSPRDVVNEIYDDFESRTCENCMYGIVEENFIECEHWDEDFPLGFCCNRFKR